MGLVTPPESDLPATRVPSSFLDLLRAAESSVEHLEMRDIYTPRDPDYLRWLDGDHFDPADRWPDWIQAVKEMVHDKGVVVRRARIISEPVTDYIRYEYALTDGLNIAAGELVRWLPRRLASDIALPGNDFWLFDNRLVRFNHFGGDGSSGDKELRQEPEVIRLCSSAFEVVWRRAIPHDSYRPK
jgi:hypothetical protein